MTRALPSVDTAVPAFSLATAIKKEAIHNPLKLQKLIDSGYVVPDHWKHPYLSRQFVAWDGEGITYDGDIEQSYVLFGASTGDRIQKPALSTRDCFDLLLSVEQVYPQAIHVGFALQYDTNMILRDLSRRHLFRIYRTNKCHWEGYRIEYRPGKWLSIRRGDIRIRLFDVFGFFQSSFVTACEEFLSVDDPELVGVREGKQARKSFTYDQLDTFIVPYWEAELRLLVRLMDSLRDDLVEADIQIRSWHGPGAVASTVLRTHNVHIAKSETSQEVNRAAQYAYAGGRFELFKAGHCDVPVYEYDINSAYPSAIAGLPNLQTAGWKRTRTFQPGSFGVWHIRHDDRSNPRGTFTKPQPLFHRDRHGNISYPAITDGWYWTPEAEILTGEVVEGYVLNDDGSRPFAFVEDMYETRRQWKQEGKSAQRALKLALNSLYGKMAQRVGYLENMEIPRWHQLEWAGYVTSATRARLWHAIAQNPSAVLAVETDALFTTEPLHLDIGKGLGQWTEERFDWITYLQSGMYYAGQGDTVIERYRGFDKGSVQHDDVMQFLRNLDDKVPCVCHPPRLSPDCPVHLHGVTTRFIGMGVSMFTKKAWRSWDTEPRHVSLGGGGKRTHVPVLCPQCKAGEPFSSTLHTLGVITAGGQSYPHPLPWVDETSPILRMIDEIAIW